MATKQAVDIFTNFSSPSTPSSSSSPSSCEDDFESLDAAEMSGLAKHVIYDVGVPVTIMAKESSLVPIFSGRVTGDLVLVYDPRVNELNAVRAVHLRNNTGQVLAPGLIAVLEDGRFVSQNQFTPMLPDDDQLVPYGYDSTLSIVKSMPSDLQENNVEGVEIIYSTDGQKRPIGCRKIHRAIRRTKYTVKNNSTERTIQKFYIDHWANVEHGGYVITTKDNCIKSVMGFSRFEFRLAPQAQVEFVVAEEANYSTDLLSTYDLTQFVKSAQAGVLLSYQVLKEETLEVLRGIVKRSEALSALSLIESERFTERETRQWRTGSTVESGMPILDKELLDKVDQVLALKTSSQNCQREIDTKKRHVEKVFQNQQRLRENIKSLDKMVGSDLMKRYLSDLDKEEDDLIQTRKQIEALEAEKHKIDASVAEHQLALAAEAKKAREALSAEALPSGSVPSLPFKPSVISEKIQQSFQDRKSVV